MMITPEALLSDDTEYPSHMVEPKHQYLKLFANHFFPGWAKLPDHLSHDEFTAPRVRRARDLAALSLLPPFNPPDDSLLVHAREDPLMSRWLLAHGCDPHHRPERGSRTQTIHMMLYSRALIPVLAAIYDIDVAGENNRTALEMVFSSLTSRLLLALGARVNRRSKYETPLVYTILDGDMEKMEVLLEAGADVNFAARNNYTPLHAAVSYQSREMVEILLDAGADINATTIYERTPLNLLYYDTSNLGRVNSGRYYHRPVDEPESIMELLLARGADPCIRPSNGTSVLICAIYRNNLRGCVEQLVNILPKSELLYIDEDGATALICAVRIGATDIVRLLLERVDYDRAYIEHKNKFGHTAFMIACIIYSKNSGEIARILLWAGARIDHVDIQGFTALNHINSHIVNDYEWLTELLTDLTEAGSSNLLGGVCEDHNPPGN